MPGGGRPVVRTGGVSFTRGSVIRSASAKPRSPISRCGGSGVAIATYRAPASWTCASIGTCLMTVSSPCRSAAAPVIVSVSWPAGMAARKRSSKCSLSSSSPGGVQPGWPASRNRSMIQRTWARASPSGAQACLSAVQPGRPCSRAMAAWASCRVANSPAARRRLASSLRCRRLGRAGSVRAGDVRSDMGSPSLRPGSAGSGRKDAPSIVVTQPVSLQLCPRTQGRPEPPRQILLLWRHDHAGRM